jgi:hypothetical protein
MSNIDVIIIQKQTTTNDYVTRIQGFNLETAAGGTGTVSVIQPNDSTSEVQLLLGLGVNTSVYNLIIYEWSDCILPANSDIYSVINSIVTSTSTWDVNYLGKWMDTCNKYSTTFDSGKFNIVANSEPVGFNAVLLTPTMTQKLITKLTGSSYTSINYALQDIGIDETIIYNAVSPNLFTYDPLYNTVDVSTVYNVKSNECIGTTTEVSPPSDNDLTFFWILLLVIGTALLIWFIITTHRESVENYTCKMDIRESLNSVVK